MNYERQEINIVTQRVAFKLQMNVGYSVVDSGCDLPGGWGLGGFDPPTLLYCSTLCYSIMNSSCMNAFTYSTPYLFLNKSHTDLILHGVRMKSSTQQKVSQLVQN